MAKFVVAAERTYWWPVKVRLPSAEISKSGTFLEFQFSAKFRMLSSETATQLIKSSPAHLMREALIGWDGIVSESDEDFPFSEENRDSVLDNSWALLGLMQAWTNSFSDTPANSP